MISQSADVRVGITCARWRAKKGVRQGHNAEAQKGDSKGRDNGEGRGARGYRAFFHERFLWPGLFAIRIMSPCFRKTVS